MEYEENYEPQLFNYRLFASQLRKLDVDLYYNTQRFNNIHKRLRVHTDVILIPKKYHMDNDEHRIIFDASNVDKLYNTKEIVMDKLIIPSRKKVKDSYI